jgi:hypothetical protein
MRGFHPSSRGLDGSKFQIICWDAIVWKNLLGTGNVTLVYDQKEKSTPSPAFCLSGKSADLWAWLVPTDLSGKVPDSYRGVCGVPTAVPNNSRAPRLSSSALA